MRPSNPKVTFDPGFFVVKKILFLTVIFCFLVFSSLVYADGPGNYDDPVGEHPWDELKSGSEHQPPKPPDIKDVIIFPCGDFGGWTIIHFLQVKDGDKGRVQIQTSDKNQGQLFILF